MKQFIISSLIVLAAVFSLAGSAQAQCQADECIAKISSGYTFLKTYKMEQVGQDTEYSYVFSKDTNYMIVICAGATPNVKVTLFDATKKPVASNFDKATNKYYAAIAYSCKATGIYYLKYETTQTGQCCVSVLSFKK